MNNSKIKLTIAFLAIVLIYISCKKKKEDPIPEPEPPAPTAPKIDYRDSITGYYNVTYTLSYDGSSSTKTRLVNVRKATAGEIPFYWQNRTTIDSCITIDSVLVSNNRNPLVISWSTKLGPNFIGYREMGSFIELSNKSFNYSSGCCGCGSATCYERGKGPKVPK